MPLMRMACISMSNKIRYAAEFVTYHMWAVLVWNQSQILRSSSTVTTTFMLTFKGCRCKQCHS